MVALLAIVLIGALVAGALFSSTLEARIGRTAVNEPRAMTMAEWGLNQRAGELRMKAMPLAADGDTAAFARITGPNGDYADTRLTRLTDASYLLTSAGTAGAGTVAETSRRTALLLRIIRPQINFLAALTTNGPTKIGGSAMIAGADKSPDGWSDCGSLLPARPAIVTNNLANIDCAGCKENTATGATPPIQQNAAAGDTNTYFKYGNDADWNSLTSMADITLPPGWNDKPEPASLNGACVGGAANWGEPWRTLPLHACASRFPLIYAQGNLQITGGRGQGILMVNGDLAVAGGFEFYGPVIVRGSLKTTGTGGHFNGGVMAANVDLVDNTVLGDAEITYSSCAIEKALTGASAQRPVNGRPWTVLY
jgi:hypothetical protein